MGMLVGKAPFVKYNKTTGEIRCQGSVCERLNVFSGEFVAFIVDNGCYVLNTETFKVADVYLPVVELVQGTSLQLSRLKNSVVFAHLDSNGAVISSAEIGVQTLLVYKIEPNDSNYEVTETNYFYELYGVNLVYTLSEPKISENLIDEILSERDSRSYTTQRVISEKLLEQLASNTVTSDADEEFLDSLNDALDSADDIDDDIESDTTDVDTDVDESSDEFNDEDDNFVDEDDDDLGLFNDEEEEEDLGFYEDDFDVEDEPDLDSLVKQGKISIPDYCKKQIEYWGLERGGIPNNKLLTSLEDMLVVLYKRFPAVQDAIVLIWQFTKMSSEYYRASEGYVYVDQNVLPCMVQFAMLLVSSECGYCKPTAITNAYIADRLKGVGLTYCTHTSDMVVADAVRQHNVQYQTDEGTKHLVCSALRAMSRRGVDMDWGLAMQKDFNSIPAFCLYLSHLIVFHFCESSNIYAAFSISNLTALDWETKLGLAYECVAPALNTPFSFDTVLSWFSPNHLVRRVRKRNFKYNLEYTSIFNADKQEYVSCKTKIMTGAVALNALLFPLCRNTTLHTFMSDTYNVVAAPNTYYSEGNYGQSNNWRGNVHFNIARRFAGFNYDERQKLKDVLGVWDAGEDIKVLSPNIVIDGVDFGIPKTSLKPFVRDWSVMCPEYDIYTRHYFDHSAFRDIAYYLYSKGMLFLLDIVGHDDSFVDMPDKEAFFVREIIMDIARTVSHFFTYVNSLFDIRDNQSSCSGTTVFRDRTLSLIFLLNAKDGAQKLSEATKFGVEVLLDTLEWLKSLYGDYANTYANFVGVVRFYSRLLECLCTIEPSMYDCIRIFKSIQSEMFKHGTNYVPFVQQKILQYTTMRNIYLSAADSDMDYEMHMYKVHEAVTKLKAIFDEQDMFTKMTSACDTLMLRCKNSNNMALNAAPQLENTFKIDFFLNRDDGVENSNIWDYPPLDYSIALFLKYKFALKSINGSNIIYMHTLLGGASKAPAGRNPYQFIVASFWYTIGQSSLFEVLGLTSYPDFMALSELDPRSFYHLLYESNFSEIERFVSVSRRALYFSSKHADDLARQNAGSAAVRFNNYIAGMMPVLVLSWFAVRWESLAALPLNLYEDVISILEKAVAFMNTSGAGVRYICRAKGNTVHRTLVRMLQEYGGNKTVSPEQSMFLIEQEAKKASTYFSDAEMRDIWVMYDFIVRVHKHKSFLRSCWIKYLTDEYASNHSSLLSSKVTTVKGSGVALSELTLLSDVTGYKTSLSPEEFFDYGDELCAISLSRLFISLSITDTSVRKLCDLLRYTESNCGHQVTTIKQFAEDVEQLDLPHRLNSGVYTDGTLLLALLYLLDTMPSQVITVDNSYNTVLQNSLKLNKDVWQGKIQFPPKDMDDFGTI